ncbi:ArgP/LysG family DNA-binding transcriptional regulator [Microvirga tunisiensis]|uniref:ArgP/LysG family DNA-binding transcriptional regulator n=1 Tax=Pannonibacter tanglangensis TaxID=2750084 RepID=A0A7X5EZJ2_9HYPH|nr:LysR family transcriptional regulator ArgP [Pannonibacter sp. XCT-53]NBN76948.1 ArgP/LysG family DNA-binding transcriptional regulator [Pannonibacter sp. XCT-53]
MNLDPSQLAALAAILRSGSFEKAALALRVTPSAVSQRLKALEERIGAVLVVRGQPASATEAGQRVLRHAEELALLERGLGRDLNLDGGGLVTVRLAVNADSLATWLVPAMAELAGEGLLFDLMIDDQDHSADWLRRGEVRAAVSGDPDPVQGCDCFALGALTYVPTASPAFRQRWFADGVTRAALARAPALTFNAKDGLQIAWLDKAVGPGLAPPTHWLASTHAFVDAALAGLGWGMNPEPLVRAALAEGRLCELIPGTRLAVPLYWHVSRSVAAALHPVTRALRAAAAAQLAPIP